MVLSLPDHRQDDPVAALQIQRAGQLSSTENSHRSAMLFVFGKQLFAIAE
jgi:hypothetical protein